jgi:hypothetical protein
MFTMCLAVLVHDVTMSHLRLMPVDIGPSAGSSSKMMKGGLVGVPGTETFVKVSRVESERARNEETVLRIKRNAIAKARGGNKAGM